jgi:hypothetical protein
MKKHRKRGKMMGVVKATAYPSRYQDEAYRARYVHAMTSAPMEKAHSSRDDKGKASETLPLTAVGKFHLQLDVRRRKGITQRRLVRILALATGERLDYQQGAECCQAGCWKVWDSGDYFSISTGLFAMSDIGQSERTLRALDALHKAGYTPDELVTIHFTPDVYDLKLVLNISTIIESRSGLITQALGLPEEIRIIVGNDLAFGIPLDAFSFEKVEACVYLLRQAIIMAAGTGKARMKPCDGSNPKFQMRSWLLRLGFIGDEYTRPRQTFLSGLSGDGAFFDEESKQKAAIKRKAKRMAG